MKQIKKAVVIFTSLTGLLFTVFWLLLATTSAYHDRPITLYFNHYGERNTEIVVLAVLVVLMAYSVVKIHQRYKLQGEGE